MVSRLTRIRPGKVAATAVAVFAFWTAPAAADTTVSLTFDDGNADQMLALPILDDHDMDGTFYIIPGRVGNANYVTWSQVDQIYDDGNEIGGHTMNHAHLTQISEDAARDEICDGRQALLDRGYPDISFAYPFGEHDDTTEGLVEECGYLSGRGVAGLQRDPGEPDAESIPPRDRWVIRTRGSVDVEDTLPEIKDWIMDAEAVDDGNGSADAWIPLVFHHLCDPNVTDCEGGPAEDQYITPSDFDALLDWLQARESAGTNVRTIGDVMGPATPPDTTPPVTAISCDGATCQSGFYNHSVSVTLSASDTGGSGLKEIRYTTNGTTPTTSSPLYTGPITVGSTTTIRYRAWDNAGNAEATKTRTISIDTVAPTNGAIQCNGGACQSSFYNDDVQVRFSGSDAGGSGLRGIRYTTDDSTPNGSSSLYVPGVSAAINVGSTDTIRFRAQDNAGNLESTVHQQTISIDTAGPTSAIQCDGGACSSGFYNQPVNATLSAIDNTGGSGVENIRYTTNGSDPTGSSPIYSGPIPISSTTTIKFRAQDQVGNVESPVKSQTISIDTVKPVSAIQCDGAACQPSYDHAVQVALSGSDTGGSGLKNIRYTTDGSDPTSSSPEYSDPIDVSSTATIKWRAEDNAGNVEAPIHSQTIEITSPPPPPPPPPGGGAPGSSGGGSGATLGAFVSSESLPNGVAKLTLEVTGPGVLEAADGRVAKTAVAAGTNGAARIRPTSKYVPQAGEVTLKIIPSKAGKKLLKKKGRLTARIRVRFTPASGSPAEQTVKVRLKLKGR